MERANTERARRSAGKRGESASPRFALRAWRSAVFLAVALLAASVLTSAASADPQTIAVEAETVPPAAAPAPVVRDLDRLLSVPSTHAHRAEARSADEAIAAAVRLGSADRIVRPSGFRKRNADLFRSEHPVEFARQEMLLRLRLRAKTRNAMSVELRF